MIYLWWTELSKIFKSLNIMIFEIVLKLILSTINGSLIAFQSRSKWSKFWPQVAQSFRRNHNVPPPLVTTRRNKRIFRIEIKVILDPWLIKTWNFKLRFFIRGKPVTGKRSQDFPDFYQLDRKMFIFSLGFLFGRRRPFCQIWLTNWRLIKLIEMIYISI